MSLPGYYFAFNLEDLIGRTMSYQMPVEELKPAPIEDGAFVITSLDKVKPTE